MGSEVARREVLIVSLAAGNKSSVAYEHRVLFVAGESRGDYLKKLVLNAGKLVAASLPLACGAGSQPGRLSRRKRRVPQTNRLPLIAVRRAAIVP